MTDPVALPLRDIHLPADVSWWPPALGWWALLSIVLLLLALALFFHRRRQRRLRSAVSLARQELARIEARYAESRDAKHCAQSLSILLRRLCVSVFPRADAAGLTGAQWLTFLEDILPGQVFSGNAARALLEAPYSKRVAEDAIAPLLAFCSDWIEALARSGKAHG